jgi:hypothetical protein
MRFLAKRENLRILRNLAAVGLIAVTACSGDAARPTGPSRADASLKVGGTSTSPRVLPPNAHPHSRTYAEWAAAWWQYVLSIPVSQNPLLDETGVNCTVGQSGHVFFLVGILNVSGTAVRTGCVVPTGVMLFFPIVNTICTNEPPPLTPTEQLRPCAAGPIETATDLAVEIDGVPVEDPERFRAQSPLFGFTLPADNLLGGAAGTCHPDPDVGACVPYLAVADGFYLMLPPLPPGEHTVHVHGVLPAFNGFTVDVTYDPLTVTPRGGLS